jgi:hypothetical protein
MKKKPKWQLNFETELSLLNNEDLLSEWKSLVDIVSHRYHPSVRISKKCNLVYEEILHRMSYWTLNRGSFNEMES